MRAHALIQMSYKYIHVHTTYVNKYLAYNRNRLHTYVYTYTFVHNKY